MYASHNYLSQCCFPVDVIDSTNSPKTVTSIWQIVRRCVMCCTLNLSEMAFASVRYCHEHRVRARTAIKLGCFAINTVFHDCVPFSRTFCGRSRESGKNPRRHFLLVPRRAPVVLPHGRHVDLPRSALSRRRHGDRPRLSPCRRRAVRRFLITITTRRSHANRLENDGQFRCRALLPWRRARWIKITHKSLV